MSLKEIIYQKCLDFVTSTVLTAQESIRAARETSHAETKSSAGDKYETTRAMMQIEIENNSKRLAEARTLQNTLLQITFLEKYELVTIGSLVQTNQGLFFIAIGIGQVRIDLDTYFVISPTAPIGELLMRKKVGDAFFFNKKNYLVLEIS